MCGIIGYTGNKDAVSIIVEGLKRLEYRGYDSAGIAFSTEKGIEVVRKKGKIRELEAALATRNPKSNTAIGHTRWATHGKPSEENAHPHRSGSIVIVHNGIIENYISLKRELQAEGVVFTSQTDTEVICHLINKHSQGRSLESAVSEALKHVKGAYALAVMSDKEPGKIVGVRKDSPLVVGIGEGEYFIASDIPAFLNHSRNAVFLDDDEMVVMTQSAINFTTFSGKHVDKKINTIEWSSSMAEKGGYRHFMLKEINEQPRAIADTITGRFDTSTAEVNLEEFGLDEESLKSVNGITIAACGTSWHSALIGRYTIEALARIPVDVDIASEFRYRNPIIAPGRLFITITQSGETADTLAAQREAKRLGAKTLTICNVIGSTASREADSVFYTRSGPEIGVASTKAFTTQIVALYILAVALAKAKGAITKAEASELLEELLTIPDKVEKILSRHADVEKISKEYFKRKDFLYLGRGINFPVALEGALKLKEISYIHAEAYPAGEMKHGPIALIDEEMPVVFIAPKDKLYEKIISNINEVKSRGGGVISLVNERDAEAAAISDMVFEIPSSNVYLSTILFSVPLQLIAYHVGVYRGCDVDQPRNLAKSVTVE